MSIISVSWFLSLILHCGAPQGLCQVTLKIFVKL